MAKLIVSEFVSLNGVMEAPGGEPTHPHSGWTFKSIYGEDHYGFKSDEIDEAETLLLGRKTYEGCSAAWPECTGPFADKINSMPKYVVSSTLTDPEWENTTVLSGDPVEQVARLRAADGGPILVNGSAQLVHALAEADLVDEYRAMVHPVLVADGLRMFPDPRDMKKLRLADVKTLRFWSCAADLHARTDAQAWFTVGAALFLAAAGGHALTLIDTFRPTRCSFSPAPPRPASRSPYWSSGILTKVGLP